MKKLLVASVLVSTLVSFTAGDMSCAAMNREQSVGGCGDCLPGYGSGGQGMCWFHGGTNNTAENRFSMISAALTPLTSFGSLSAVNAPQIECVDIDGDMDLDCFVCSDSGTVIYLENQGNVAFPNFVEKYGTGNPLDAVSTPNPCRLAFADMDADNDLDVFVSGDGKTPLFYKNMGNNSHPSFVKQTGSGNPLGALGTILGIALSGLDVKVAVVDVDDDGDADILLSTKLTGFIYLKNTGSASTPLFLGIGTNPLHRASGADTVRFVDLDGDGKRDAFVGGDNGLVRIMANEGSVGSPDFQTPDGSLFTDMTFGAKTEPSLADLDGDGDFDLLVGYSAPGGLAWLRNTANECLSGCSGRGSCVQAQLPSLNFGAIFAAAKNGLTHPDLASGQCQCLPNAVGEACEQCAPGFFGPTCESSCPEFAYTNLSKYEKLYPGGPTSSDCICQDGFVNVSYGGNDAGFQCVCPPGFNFNQWKGTCEKCDLGTFKTDSSLDQCESCQISALPDPRATTRSTASKLSSDCVCKYTFTLVNETTCLCGPGTGYLDLADICELCPVGYYKSNYSLTTCLSCEDILGPRATTGGRGSISSLNCTCKASFTEHNGDCLCEPGKGFNVNSGVCETCSQGYFSDAYSLDPCQSCESSLGTLGTTLSMGSTAADACVCRSTFTLSSNGTCTCVPGFEFDSDNNICSKCPIGTFKDDFGLTACQPCLGGSSTIATGADTDQLCLCPNTMIWDSNICTCGEGSTMNNASFVCEQCSVGFFKDSVGKGACTSCEDVLGPFATTRAKGASSHLECQCKDTFTSNGTFCGCGIGWGYLSTGNVCQLCPIGTYSANHDLEPCQSCTNVLGVHGTTNAIGSTGPTACQCDSSFLLHPTNGQCVCGPGTGFDTNLTVCLTCEKGFFSDTWDLSPCERCPGTAALVTTSRTGSTGQLECACAANLAMNETGICGCPAGSGFVENPVSCRSCPIGSYSSNFGVNDCQSCTGILGPLATTADIGSVVPAECICPPSLVAKDGDCICPPGWGWSTTISGICEICGAGTVGLGIDRSPCRPCEFGETTFLDGSSQCTPLRCPAGMERDKDFLCVPCPEHTYRPGDSDSQSCFPCPESRPLTAGAGTTSEKDCLPGYGSFLVDASEDPIDCANEKFVGAIDCKQIGLTLETLPLVAKYWRISNRSMEIRRCPQASFCVPESSSSPPLQRRLELTVVENDGRKMFSSDSYCSPHHTGVFCLECDPGYALRDGKCAVCERTWFDRFRFVSFVVCSVLVMLLPWLSCCNSLRTSRVSKQISVGPKEPPGSNILDDKFDANVPTTNVGGGNGSLLKRIARSHWTKVRIAFGYYQILLNLTATVGLLNGNGLEFLMSLVDVDIAVFVESLEIGCDWPMNFYDGLQYRLVLPALWSIFALAAFSISYQCFGCESPVFVATVDMVKATAQLLILSYPGTSSTIFKTFLSDDLKRFDNDDRPFRALRYDYSIDFDSEESRRMRVVAAISVLVYPIGGLMLIYGLVGFSLRAVTATGNNSVRILLKDKLNFLHMPYYRSWKTFEVFDLLRKLVSTSVFVIVHQELGERISVVLFCLVNIISLLLLSKRAPYNDPSDEFLAESSILILIIVGGIVLLPSEFRDSFIAIAKVGAVVIEMVLLILAIRLSQYYRSRAVFTLDEDTESKYTNSFRSEQQRRRSSITSFGPFRISSIGRESEIGFPQQEQRQQRSSLIGGFPFSKFTMMRTKNESDHDSINNDSGKRRQSLDNSVRNSRNSLIDSMVMKRTNFFNLLAKNDQ